MKVLRVGSPEWGTVATEEKQRGCLQGAKALGIEEVAAQSLQFTRYRVDGRDPRGPRRPRLGGGDLLGRRLEYVTEKE
jgi:hypothetical protein